MKMRSALPALLAVPMLAACTSASLTWLDGGKMTMTYETPHIQAGVEKAFDEATERMEALCVGQGGDVVVLDDLVRKKVSSGSGSVVEPQSDFSAIFSAVKEIAGKTTVTIQGTCTKK